MNFSRYALFALISLFPLASQAGITIVENNIIEYGTVLIPSGTENVIINGTNGSVSGSGTLITANQARGQYTITNTDNVTDITITVDIQNINTGTSNITLDQFNGQFGATNISSFPISGLPLLHSQSKTLYLGARLGYNHSVNDAEYNPAFDIVVDVP